MILGDVEETVTTIEIDEETYEEVYRSTKRNIPMLYVRGDSVILVSPPSRSTNWSQGKPRIKCILLSEKHPVFYLFFIIIKLFTLSYNITKS